MSTHTPGRLVVKGGWSIYADGGKTPVADACIANNTLANDEANARRLVAAWNACEGIPTETLEKHSDDRAPVFALLMETWKQRDELLAVLKAFSNYVQSEQCATDGAVSYSTTAINHWAFLARAAIQKAEGK